MIAFLSRIGFLRMTILLQMHCPGGTCVGLRSSFHSNMAEVSVLEGLVHPDLVPRVQQLLQNRLAPSSQSTIATALKKWWIPFCNHYDLDLYIPSGDPRRAGIMASFVLYMVTHGHLKYGTMQGYIWGVVDHHLQHGRASPLTNVRDWRSFMSAVEIEDPHVPVARLMVPILRDGAPGSPRTSPSLFLL
jgi:hypothetical protein